MQAPDVAEAGGLGEPGDRLHQSDGPAQGQHLGDRQVDDEGLQIDAVLQRSGHGLGKPPPAPAFLDLGAALDDLEDDVVRRSRSTASTPSAPQASTATVSSTTVFRRLSPVCRFGFGPLPLAPLVLVRLRRRKAGVGAGRLLQQDGNQDAHQGGQHADYVIGLSGYLAGRAAVLAASNSSPVAIIRPRREHRLALARQHLPVPRLALDALTVRAVPPDIAGRVHPPGLEVEPPRCGPGASPARRCGASPAAGRRTTPRGGPRPSPDTAAPVQGVRHGRLRCSRGGTAGPTGGSPAGVAADQFRAPERKAGGNAWAQPWISSTA